MAAGGIARAVLAEMVPGLELKGFMTQIGPHGIEGPRDMAEIDKQPVSGCPRPKQPRTWADYLGEIRKRGSSVGAVVEVVAKGVPRRARRPDLCQARHGSGRCDDVDQCREGRGKSVKA